MRKKLLRNENGQVIIWVAVALPILILFTALAVDMGAIYMTKAKLTVATDAAVLTGVKNYPLGTTTAQNLATDMFQANFGSSSPTLNYTWCPSSDPSCSGPTVSLKLHSTTTVNTAFMKYLPNFAQWTIGDTAASTRSNLVMSLVLDRSGSMNNNGGMTALKAAVPIFINNFIEGTDHLAMVSFASHASLDVPMTLTFKSPINTAAAALNPSGGTFGTGAGSDSYGVSHGPPLSLADSQNNSVVFASGTPETKVAIYFTDGLMNAVQDSFHCLGNNNTWTLLNFGGYDVNWWSDNTTYGTILDPNNGTQYGDASSSGFPYDSSHTCKDASGNVTTFPSQRTGGPLSLLQSNITKEAQYRALQTAHAMRSESPIATYIYVIGLGTAISTDGCTEAFLSTLANDPNGPTNYTGIAGRCSAATYDNTLPDGLFLVVSQCPGAQCTTQLTKAFQTIAAKVLLRLSQ